MRERGEGRRESHRTADGYLSNGFARRLKCYQCNGTFQEFHRVPTKMTLNVNDMSLPEHETGAPTLEAMLVVVTGENDNDDDERDADDGTSALVMW